MTPTPHSQKQNHQVAEALRRFATVVAYTTLAGGLLVLAGWQLDILVLKSLLPGLATMKANTALAFALCGAALLLGGTTSPHRAGVARVCITLVTAISVLTLSQYLFDWNLGVDELLFPDPDGAAAGRPPGRMAPMTAICFLLIAMSLQRITQSRGQPVLLGSVPAFGVAGTTFIALLGYMYGVSALYSVGGLTSMALHTALLLFLLAVACILSTAKSPIYMLIVEDSSAGYVVRRMLPSAIFIPPLLGGLRLLGERAGLYPFEFGLALFASSNVVAFSTLVVTLARKMREIDNRRQRAEESGDWKAALLNSTDLAVISCDPQGIIRTCNMGALKRLGYRSDEVLGKILLSDLLDPDELRQKAARLSQQSGREVTAGFEALVLTAGSPESDWIYRQKEGGSAVIRQTISIVLDRDGTAQGFLCVGKDVTKQKEAERELAKANADLQNVMRHMPALVLYLDNNLAIQFSNHALTAWFGHTPEPLRGTPLASIIGTNNHARLATSFEVTLTGQVMAIETIFEFPGKPDRQALLSLVPDREEGITRGIYLFATDTTLLNVAQAERIVALEMLQSVLNAATEFSIIATTPEGIISLFSSGAERMLGYDAAELVGRHTPALIHVPEEVAARGDVLSARFGKPIQGFDVFVELARHGEAESCEWTYVCKSGRHITVNLTVTAIRDGGGRITGFLGIAKDICRDKEMREALALAKERAEAASITKGQFLANMSHEIRTPMNAILGMAQLLSQTTLDAQQKLYLSSTQSAARSLLGLLNNILDYSKIEAGKMSLDLQLTEVDKFAEDLAVILAAGTTKDNVEVELDIDPELPSRLMLDPLRLQQVLINLAGNALKFTHNGHVSISLRRECSTPDSVVITFAVTDTGIGISEPQISLIFQGFEQAEASTSRRYGGTGLGLAISQRLVALMGGELQVDSIPGAGSCFYFSLALGYQKDEPSLAVRHRQHFLQHFPERGSLSLLYLGNNPINSAMVQRIARVMGWRCEARPISDATLSLLNEKGDVPCPYTVALIDFGVSDRHLLPCALQIHRACRRQALPALIMTALSKLATAGAPDEGNSPYERRLTTPFTAAMLLQAIEATLMSTQDALPPAIAASGRRLAGLRLLLVEDNPLNQLVARELLTREGADVQVADNGRDGVAATLRAGGQLDAVLMDMHMPDMDGYAATQEIRRHRPASDLPIIAITANTQPADIASCREAGIDDHIGKPYEIDALIEMIRKHCPAAPAADDPASMVATALPEYSADNLIDTGLALRRLGQDRRLYGRLLRRYAAETAQAPQEIQALLTGGQGADVSLRIHSLKGMAGTIGATLLADRLEILEARLSGGDIGTETTRLLERTFPLMEVVTREAGAMASGFTPSQDSSVPLREEAGPASALEQLKMLVALLEGSNMDAIEFFSHLQLQHGDTPELAPIASAIEKLDFQGALTACQHLLSSLTQTSQHP